MSDLGAQGSAAARKAPGRLDRMMFRLFMRPARITSVELLSEHFRQIDLEGEDLRHVQWQAGEKVQIAMEGSAFQARTYTPIAWDKERGRARIIAYAHGTDPGSDWTRSVRTGDRCHLFGPRKSLEADGIAAPTFLFGDETGFGLALAIAERTRLKNGLGCLFEVSAITESRAILERLGLADATIAERTPTNGHLE